MCTCTDMSDYYVKLIESALDILGASKATWDEKGYCFTENGEWRMRMERDQYRTGGLGFQAWAAAIERGEISTRRRGRQAQAERISAVGDQLSLQRHSTTTTAGMVTTAKQLAGRSPCPRRGGSKAARTPSSRQPSSVCRSSVEELPVGSFSPAGRGLQSCAHGRSRPSGDVHVQCADIAADRHHFPWLSRTHDKVQSTKAPSGAKRKGTATLAS